MTTAEIFYPKPVLAGLKEKLDVSLKAVARAFSKYIDSRARVSQIEALNRRSDADLARLGLRREDIVYHVWRDQFYI